MKNNNNKDNYNHNNKDNSNISNIIQTEPSKLSEEFQVVAPARSESFVVVNKKNIPDSRPSSPFEVIDNPQLQYDLGSSVPFNSPKLYSGTQSPPNSPRSNNSNGGGCSLS